MDTLQRTNSLTRTAELDVRVKEAASSVMAALK